MYAGQATGTKPNVAKNYTWKTLLTCLNNTQIQNKIVYLFNVLDYLNCYFSRGGQLLFMSLFLGRGGGKACFTFGYLMRGLRQI